jgi:hypothetical protein
MTKSLQNSGDSLAMHMTKMAIPDPRWKRKKCTHSSGGAGVNWEISK